MNSLPQLTAGAVQRMFKDDVNHKPTVQIIDVKKIAQAGANPSANSRYRLIISDGVHYQQAMLATQLNQLIDEQRIVNHCIVRLDEFICNIVSMKRIVIVLNLEVLHQGPGSVIGKPQNVEAGADAGDAQAQQQQQAPQQQQRPPMQQQQQQQQQRFGGQQQPKRRFDESQYRDISSLNPYHNHWVIKARVTNKSPMKNWSNAKGEGKLFSVDLLDANGGEIRATMFNGAADKFFPIFAVNKVFTVSGGHLKMANKKFSRIDNDYEITLNEDAVVEFCEEDDGSIDNMKYNFVPIVRIQDKNDNDNVDVIGIVKSVGQLRTIVAKTTKKEIPKRDITICDESASDGVAAIDVTLWGEEANKWTEEALAGNPVVALKAARVSDFSGKSLSSGFNSTMSVNPDRPEAHKLRAWWDNQGNSMTVRSLTSRGAGRGNAPRRTLSDINDMNLGKGEKPDIFQCKLTATFFKSDMEKPPYYKACKTDKCNKKVTEGAGGMWFCPSCNIQTPDYETRYIMACMCADSTASKWLSAFHEVSEQVLGVSAVEMESFVNNGNKDAFDAVFKKATFKTFNMVLKASLDTGMQDEMRTRLTVLRCEPVNWVTESQHLLEQISLYD